MMTRDEKNVNKGENGYWQDIHRKDIDSQELKDEFKEGDFDSFSVVKNRRDFLKIMGFSFTVLPMAACTKGPIKKAIPYLEKNDKIIPGQATWFATKYEGCNCGAPLLIKTREGRPIKVEGNDKSVWSRGGACSVCQASILSLYDSYRLRAPQKNHSEISWNTFQTDFSDALNKAKSDKKKIILVTGEVRSPSTSALIEDFSKFYENVEHYVYAPFSLHEGKNELYYSFDQADYVLGIGSDFLATENNSTAYARQYADKKDVSSGKIPLKHVQIESLLSLTGSNADERYPLDDDDIKKVLLLILGNFNGEKVSVNASSELTAIATKLIKDLASARGRSLLINGLRDLNAQRIVNKINSLLGNLGKTVNAYESEAMHLGNDERFEEMLNAVSQNKKEVGTIIFADVNPFYSYPNNEKLKKVFEKIPTKFSLAFSEDETSVNCDYLAPIHHSYESWNDTFISPNEIAITQAVITPLFNSLQLQDILLKAMGRTESFNEYMQEVWRKKYLSSQKNFLTIAGFWNQSVHDGVVFIPNALKETRVAEENIASAVSSMLQSLKNNDEPTLVLYQKVSMKDGRHANNPWLQELPDPITKATWDNYFLVSPHLAKKYSLATGDVVEISAGKAMAKLSVLVQPGLAKNTIGMAIGYGRSVSGKVGKNLGANAYLFSSFKDGMLRWTSNVLNITKTGTKYELALTQTHHSLEGRDIIRETSFKEFKVDPKAGNTKKTHLISMWSERKKTGHQWAMAIDLNKCNGCSACVVSCNAENNIPVVGRDEVRNRREMHWIRLDRYYKGSEESPTVSHQPMTCHQCDNAPCETVCPVLATVHSSDGINQQVYNRCVGTRYCANNCPYKVRRFNWFDYPHNDQNEKMVLNPDVTVRSRGVMEKCSLCIQRIQEAKLIAKQDGRDLKDGEIKLACQQSCPSDAIVFGDLSDPKSKISKVINDPRNFTVLEELNVKPRLSYLTKIRNKD